MRCFFIALAIAGAAAVGFAQERSSSETPPPARSTKIEQLLKKVAHFEEVGRKDEAQKLHRQIEREKIAAVDDIKVLQAEIERLRELTAHPMIVSLRVRMLEISREKLQSAGIDTNGSHSHVLDVGDRRLAAIESLLKDGPAKVLASPMMMTLSGRACSIHVGGHVPIPTPQDIGDPTIKWKKYGMSVDFLPVVLADRTIRMECRVEKGELDTLHSITIAGTKVPGVRSRSMETATEIRPGQTLLVGGMVQSHEVEGVNKEVEMLVLLTPEIVEPLEAKP